MPASTRATLTRDMPDHSRIVAHAVIQDLSPDTQPPYFSLTGDVYYRHGSWSGAAQQRNGREADSGGCIHGEIVRAFPILVPLASLHLSAVDTGEPMHALANARYFWRGAHVAYELKNYGADYVSRHGSGAERAAQILRVAVADLPDPATTDDDAFAAYVDTLRPTWALEAAAGLALIEQIAGQS